MNQIQFVNPSDWSLNQKVCSCSDNGWQDQVDNEFTQKCVMAEGKCPADARVPHPQNQKVHEVNHVRNLGWEGQILSSSKMYWWVRRFRLRRNTLSTPPPVTSLFDEVQRRWPMIGPTTLHPPIPSQSWKENDTCSHYGDNPGNNVDPRIDSNLTLWLRRENVTQKNSDTVGVRGGHRWEGTLEQLRYKHHFPMVYCRSQLEGSLRRNVLNPFPAIEEKITKSRNRTPSFGRLYNGITKNKQVKMNNCMSADRYQVWRRHNLVSGSQLLK